MKDQWAAGPRRSRTSLGDSAGRTDCNHMKTVVLILSVLLVASTASARIRPGWSDEMLTNHADLIIIATPVSTHGTGQKTNFPGLAAVHKGVERPVPAMGVETVFRVLSVLKGTNTSNTVVFYHLRETGFFGRGGPGAPETVVFVPKQKKRFLLFLKHEPDGRYSSVTGQVDPVLGIKDLGKVP